MRELLMILNSSLKVAAAVSQALVEQGENVSLDDLKELRERARASEELLAQAIANKKAKE